MPIYEYQCESCGPFEVTQRITEPALAAHPACGGAVRRLLSHTSFTLKGTGWYATDYGRKSEPKSEAKKDEKPKDPKPAAKTDAAAAA